MTGSESKDSQHTAQIASSSSSLSLLLSLSSLLPSFTVTTAFLLPAFALRFAWLDLGRFLLSSKCNPSLSSSSLCCDTSSKFIGNVMQHAHVSRPMFEGEMKSRIFCFAWVSKSCKVRPAQPFTRCVEDIELRRLRTEQRALRRSALLRMKSFAEYAHLDPSLKGKLSHESFASRARRSHTKYAPRSHSHVVLRQILDTRLTN